VPGRALKLSVLFNLVLLSVVAYLAHRLQDHSPLSHPISSSSSGDPVSFSSPPPALTTFTPPRPSPQPEAPAFNWSQVESADYKTFIKNLRAIGCPEQTIRDIISADVAQNFSKQRAEIITSRDHDFLYWHTPSTSPAQAAAFAQQKAALDAQMRTTLSELLGPDATLADTTPYWRASEIDHKLSFLPQDVRRQVEALDLRYQEVNSQIKSLTDWNPISNDPTELQAVLASYAERKAQLAQLLTPEQLKQYDMVTSFTGDNLRRRMARFDPTPEEFEMIFDTWRAHDENLAQLRANDQPDPGNTHVFEKIRRALGDERFSQYRSNW
jgi:hypothetical protein